MKRLSIILGILTLYGCANRNRTSKMDNTIEEEQQWNIEDIKRADKYFERGLEYDLQGDNSLALSYYDSAIRIYPGTSYYTNRGAVKYELGDTMGAMNDFMKVLETDSMNYTSLTNIGILYSEYGNNKEALKYYQESESIAPKQANIYMYLGMCLYELDDFHDALKNFEKHVNSKYNTHLDYTFYMMGNCHEKLNEIQVAEVYWKKAAEMEYEDAITKMNSLKNLKK